MTGTENRRKRFIIQSLLMGLFCSAVGIGMGFFVWKTAIGKGYEVMPILAGTSSFLVGSSLWYLLVVRKPAITVKRGFFTGLLITLVSHYFTFYLYILSANISYWILGNRGGSFEPPGDPLNGIWGALGLTLWSLLFFGWLTVPLGATIGAFYGWYLKHKQISPLP
ncbi:MAG: hypothetical protein Q7T11_09770 [Deltaproteobacteria bacterium]|nr:hypothetical protein [Deltaproteobacteria bacterium]